MCSAQSRSTDASTSNASSNASLRSTTSSSSTPMENPHAERQAAVLERLVKNANKTIELLAELNHCVEQISHANRDVKVAASLFTKYRKNVQFNLDATQNHTSTS